MKKFTALVPMKANSERVPHKNIRDLCNRPLFYYILETLSQTKQVGEILVDTDGDIIKERILSDFPDVTIIDRPGHLRGSLVPMNDIIAYDIQQTDNDHFLQTHCTNPLLRSETIDEAIRKFFSLKGYDSLFSANAIRKRCYDINGNPINHDLRIMERTQDMKPVYAENSCIFLFTRASFELNNNRIGKKPYMFGMDEAESMDIDTEFDFNLVKCILEKNIKGTC